MVDESNYVSISGWMVTELGLHGKELVAYAIVHGFSQDGCGWYMGGRKYIAEWLGCTAKTAGSVLSRLLGKGLVVREEVTTENGKSYRYRALREKNDLGRNGDLGKKTPIGKGRKRPRGREENAPININRDNKEDDKHIGAELASTIEEFTDDPSMQEALTEFCKMREKLRRPLTPYALSRCLQALRKMPESQRMESIDATMMNGWLTFYPPKSAPDITIAPEEAARREKLFEELKEMQKRAFRDEDR